MSLATGFGSRTDKALDQRTLKREFYSVLGYIFFSFLPRDARSASAVLLSYVVRLSVRPSVTSMYAEHIGWTSSKLITRIISLGSSLLGATTSPI